MSGQRHLILLFCGRSNQLQVLKKPLNLVVIAAQHLVKTAAIRENQAAFGQFQVNDFKFAANLGNAKTDQKLFRRLPGLLPPVKRNVGGNVGVVPVQFDAGNLKVYFEIEAERKVIIQAQRIALEKRNVPFTLPTRHLPPVFANDEIADIFQINVVQKHFVKFGVFGFDVRFRKSIGQLPPLLVRPDLGLGSRYLSGGGRRF